MNDYCVCIYYKYCFWVRKCDAWRKIPKYDISPLASEKIMIMSNVCWGPIFLELTVSQWNNVTRAPWAQSLVSQHDWCMICPDWLDVFSVLFSGLVLPQGAKYRLWAHILLETWQQLLLKYTVDLYWPWTDPVFNGALRLDWILTLFWSFSRERCWKSSQPSRALLLLWAFQYK